MPYKPVGVDEFGNFPPRVNSALKSIFVTKPANLIDGQVPVWDADTDTWVAGNGGGGGSSDPGLPASIDGGIWDPETSTWIAPGTDQWHLPLVLDGGVWDLGMNAWDYGVGTWVIPNVGSPEVDPDIDGGSPTSS